MKETFTFDTTNLIEPAFKNIASNIMKNQPNIFEINEVLIVDCGVENSQVLLEEINPSIDIRFVSEGENGLNQIIEAMALPNLRTINILAHGAAGKIILGGRTISGNDFCEAFNGCTDRELDIVFWSCNTGDGDLGQFFMESVAKATGARVFASKGLVGDINLGGSWKIDGVVKPPFTLNAQNNYAGVLMIIKNINVIEANAQVSNSNTFPIADLVIINDTGVNIGILTATTINDYNHANIDAFNVSDNAVTFNVTQGNAIDAANMVFDATDTVTVVDYGANIGARTVAAINGYNDANINAFNATDNAVTFNVAQANVEIGRAHV